MKFINFPTGHAAVEFSFSKYKTPITACLVDIGIGANILVQMVKLCISWGLFSIEVDAQARGFAAAVITDGHMIPLVGY